tara:strand:- start:68 stop:793 length:726 start_codon:yes stop_codon:yes gene_type:complete
MRINYNFAFKNSNLKRWIRPAPPNLLATDASLKKKILYLKDQFIGNPEIFYPPSFILLFALLLQLINIYPSKVSEALKSEHDQYSAISNKLANLNASKQRFKKNINNLDSYFTEATTSYLFAYYLQNSVPEGVKLLNYSFSDNGFEINANSYTLDSLNQFLTLIIESPVVKKNTVMINQLNRKQISKSNDKSIDFEFDLSVYGEVKKLNLRDRENFYKESDANGLLSKFLRFKNLNKLLGS